jgi:hypothetical protein
MLFINWIFGEITDQLSGIRRLRSLSVHLSRQLWDPATYQNGVGM